MATVIGAGDIAANLGRLAVLAVPTVVGAVMVRRRVVRDVPAAVGALNVYTLHVGFPALVALGVLRVEPALARQWGFWVAMPLIGAVLVGVAGAWGRVLPGRQGGSMALVLLFGNTAYLGIPFVTSVLGPEAQGPAALLVALQVGLAVLVGPALLHRWSGEPGAGIEWSRLTRQPLLLAPFAGVLIRLVVPADWWGGVEDVLGPIGASTAPVAMFLLGLYLGDSWGRVGVASPGLVPHVVARIVVAPIVGLGVGWALFAVGALSGTSVAVVMLLSGMPAAISTFSLAHHEGVAADRVASVVVWSSVGAAVSLPLLATFAEFVSGW